MIAGLMFVTGLGFSQQDAKATLKEANKEKLTTEQRVEKRVAKLTTELGLNTTQQKQVNEVLLAKAKAKKAKMAEHKTKKAANDAAVKKEFSQADKEKFKAERQVRMNEYDAKMKSILTAEQYTKWKANVKGKAGKKGEKGKKWKKQ